MKNTNTSATHGSVIILEKIKISE